jgi:4-hydroxy-3-methylbut-2-enyl diphosphate reductase
MKRKLHVRLASPRGFCAGVERAIRAVEEALAAHGAPVYVRHEIVHNAHVVTRLRRMGAVFIEDVGAAPPDRPIIFSAHGAPESAYDDVAARSMVMIDATCPLVKKVHAQARRLSARGFHVLLIGHRGHPEVQGTMGQVTPGAVSLIESAEDARAFLPPAAPLAYVTQTTLSVDDTAGIIAVLEERFPGIEGPRTSDICYATSNRQAAAKEIGRSSDLVIVIGSPTSSNSCRLVEVARAAGCPQAFLVDDPAIFDLSLLRNIENVGVTAGASAPELLVEALLARLAEQFDLTIETIETAKEDVTFKSPMLLAS